jgi:hypothetical protein
VRRTSAVVAWSRGKRAGAVVGAVALAAVTLAACGGKSGGGTAASTTASAVRSTGPSAVASSPAPLVSTAGSNQPPTGSAKVAFGQSSLVALEDFTTSKTNPIKLTLSLQQGSLADLQNFQLDAQTKQSTPYYLTIAVTNVGTTTIDTSGFAGLLTVNDTAGDEVSTITLLGDFAKCEGEIPDTLAPGASGQECDVYTAPQGQQASSASIDNGSGDATVTWS